MGFKVEGSGGGGMSEINVTPLIDIMLVMLIIFMVITPPTISQIQGKLPEKSEEVPEDQVPKDQLLAAVCKDGSITLNRQVVTLEELAIQVEKRIASTDKLIFVDAHPDAPYEVVTRVMDASRDKGAEKIGIAKLKTEEEFRACDPITAAPAPVEGAAPPTVGG
ncbi:MAG: biopolymer transporter ExbD [Deltaproteobacteria bacterium]|nr:biopolymer transporter ExbD [Deltaproteobacteria bacterium]